MLSKRPKYGRPADDTRNDAFIKVAEYLKANDEEQTTILDLIEKMGEFLLGTDCTPYGFTYMKECIQKLFGQDITIAEINGKENVVTFRHRASAIIHEFHQKPKETSSEAEKMRLIKTAAKLIKSDVKSVEQSIDMYPCTTEMSSTEEAMSFLPESLKLHLQTLFVGRNADQAASVGRKIVDGMVGKKFLDHKFKKKKTGCDFRHTFISEKWQRICSDRSTTVVPTSEYGRITL